MPIMDSCSQAALRNNKHVQITGFGICVEFFDPMKRAGNLANYNFT